jgi:formyl-CoA transferase
VVHTSLLAGVVAIHTFQGTRYLIAGEVPEPDGNRHPTVAPYGSYACSDGMLQIAVGNDAIWARFAALLGLDVSDPRFARNGDRVANTEALDRLIGELLAGDTVAAWLERFAAVGVPAGRIKSLDEVYASEQVLSQGLVAETEHATLGPIRTPGPPLRFGRSRRRDHTAPPTLGQHTAAISEWLHADARLVHPP